MATLDKAALLKRQRSANTEEVDLGDGTVTVRGLSRGEVTAAKAAAKGSRESQIDAVENHFIAAALVDPEMTVEEVAEWLENAPAGDAVVVMEAIQALSGMSEGAQKSGVAGVRKRR